MFSGLRARSIWKVGLDERVVTRPARGALRFTRIRVRPSQLALASFRHFERARQAVPRPRDPVLGRFGRPRMLSDALGARRQPRSLRFGAGVAAPPVVPGGARFQTVIGSVACIQALNRHGGKTWCIATIFHRFGTPSVYNLGRTIDKERK